MRKKPKKNISYSLPFWYSETDRKQAKLYLIIIALMSGDCSLEDFEILKKHIFYRLRHFSISNREDIFSDFLISIILSSANPQVYQTNIFIHHRLINAIKRFKRNAGRIVYLDEITIEEI